jgi:hypothetical protein
MIARPKWVLQTKKSGAQNLGGQYLSFQPGNLAAPRLGGLGDG